MDLCKRIIEEFNLKEDPIEIARKFDFFNHYEMYDFMSDNGYVWSSKLRNYKKGERKKIKRSRKEDMDLKDNDVLNKYLPLLESLYKEYDIKDKENNFNRLVDKDSKNILIESDDFKIDINLYEKLIKFCNRKNININLALEEAIEDYIKNND